MVNSPFLVSGTIYDTSGTAVGSGLTVVLENLTNHESVSVSTDSNGVYQIEHATLTTALAANDWISVSVTYNGKNQYGEILAKVSSGNITNPGFWATANIYMRSGTLQRASGSSMGVKFLGASHYGATAYTIWFLDRTNVVNLPFRVMHVMNVGANADVTCALEPFTPLRFDGGVRVIQCATAPTNYPNSMTAGVANVIGDTAKENTHVTVIVG